MSPSTRRTRPKIEQENSQARPATIEVQTQNGFSIVRRCDFDQRSSINGTEHCFVVKDPHEYELDITVDFSEACIEEVKRRSSGRLTLENTYWITTAERHLSDYLWENDDYPPDAKITIDYLTPVDIDLAQRWPTDMSAAVLGPALRLAFIVLLIAFPSLVVRAQVPAISMPVTASPGHTTIASDKAQKEPVSFADKAKALGDQAETAVDAVTSENPSPPPSKPGDSPWHYGGFFDAGYLLDFNHPENRVFRSRGTTWHVDRPQINMAAFYLRKKATEDSRWGVELTAQAGKDAELFGFSATAPNIGGYKVLRQLGPTNASYLAPIGKGLTIQGGIFSSFIGYDSLYAKDNFNYTRPWGADFTPYLMMGVNVSYPFTKKLTGSFFLVNGYWHLANANHVPSWGGQAAYTATSHLTVKQTVLAGPHQSNTPFKFWRFLADTILEHKTEKRTIAFDTNFSTEQVNSMGTPRAWWFAAQAPMKWIINPRWSFSLRPEAAWDSLGRWTLARQTVFAFTTTVEYKLAYKVTTTIFRLEHRFDRSTGSDGGFFRGRVVSPGVIPLTPSQQLLIFATIFTFDR